MSLEKGLAQMSKKLKAKNRIPAVLRSVDPDAKNKLPRRLWPIRLRMKAYQKYYESGGVIAALHDALLLARDSGGKFPNWVMDATIELVGQRMIQGQITGRGRVGNERSKNLAYARHFERWREVTRLHELGTGWKDVYAIAAENLCDTFAKGTEDTIAASYKKVNKELEDETKSTNYFQPSHDARKKSGIPATFPGKNGKRTDKLLG